MLTSAAAPAAERDGKQIFQSGRTAFEAGDYATALASFEAALAARMEGPAVHFNIGVAAYRLKQYARAEQAFLEVARTPSMAPLAHYNLGLVALERGDAAAARQWFARSEAATTDDRLRSLAATQLSRLPVEPPHAWTLYAASSAGHDDNVALVSSSDVLGVSGTGDEFVAGQFVFSFPYQDWRFDAGAMLLKYGDLDEFDQASANGGAYYGLGVGSWDVDVGVELAHDTLGGDSFEDVQTAVVDARTDLSDAWQLLARYRLSNVDGSDEFSGISGIRQNAGIRVTWRTAPWRVTAGYQIEDSNLDDEALSQMRHQLTLGVEHTLETVWTIACQLGRSHSRFDSAASGTEDRTELEASVARTLSAGWQIVLSYAYADNEADRAAFDYQRNRISLGIELIL